MDFKESLFWDKVGEGKVGTYLGRGWDSSPGVERGGEIEETKGDLLSKSLFLIVF